MFPPPGRGERMLAKFSSSCKFPTVWKVSKTDHQINIRLSSYGRGTNSFQTLDGVQFAQLTSRSDASGRGRFHVPKFPAAAFQVFTKFQQPTFERTPSDSAVADYNFTRSTFSIDPSRNQRTSSGRADIDGSCEAQSRPQDPGSLSCNFERARSL